MTLRELASPRFYAWLIADLDLGRSDVADPAPALPPRRIALEIDDDFEETRPCPWYVTTTDDPPEARP